VDSTKLDKALENNLEGVSKLFASGTGSTSGYGKQLDALVESLTKSGGSLRVAEDGVTATIKELDQQYDAMKTRVDAKVEIYRAQFTQLDVLISSMNSTMSYLTAQFEAMNASTA
jgi:flagellar hook-associated protein 2